MHVNVTVLIKVSVDEKLFRPRAHIAVGRLRRFAHHFAQLAGENEVALAAHHGDLDGGGVATRFGPDKPRGNTHLIMLSRGVKPVAGGAQEFMQLSIGHQHLLGFARDNLLGHFTANRGYFALKTTYSGFAGVLIDDFT
ncbi:MAG: hypothetical protein DDT35_00982 [Firmicutes bacterium]|nr:hypothetical protein [Bacillota bacterium]